jgi:hypothetical protein
MKVITYLSTPPKKNCRKVGSQGSLGQQSHSRIEALFVPVAQEFGEVFKGIGWNVELIFICHMENNYGIQRDHLS